jgi:hypothetical protein
MREPYDEGVANHVDPESCAVGREALGEALTGARAGQDIEPRNQSDSTLETRPNHHRRAPRTSSRAEGNTGTIANRQIVAGSPRSKTLSMYGTSAHGSWEIPSLATADGVVVRRAKPGRVSRR